MFTIQHSAGAIGRVGAGAVAGIQASELVTEAHRREVAFQQDREIAEQQVQLRQQALDLNETREARAADDHAFSQMARAFDFEDREIERGYRENAERRAQENHTLDREVLSQNQKSAELERGFRERELGFKERQFEAREAAQVLQMDEREAEKAFQTIRLAGVSPADAQGALEQAGALLGGGMGSALQMVARMAPTRAAVFARMSPEAQGQFLVEEARAQRQQQFDTMRRELPTVLSHLGQLGALSPEEAQEIAERATEASDEELQSLVGEVEVRQSQFRERQVMETARTTLSDQIGSQRKRIAEVLDGMQFDDGPAPKLMRERLEALDQLAIDLALPTFPDVAGFERQFRSIAKGLPEGQGGGELPASIDFQGLRDGAGPQEQEEPAIGYRVWGAEVAQKGDVERAVGRMASIVTSDELDDDAKSDQIERFVGKFGFDLADPDFLQEVRKEIERRESETFSGKLKGNGISEMGRLRRGGL